MYTVNTDGLACIAEEMQNQIRELNKAILEVEEVIARLRRLSGMDSVSHSLQREKEQLISERWKLMHMMSCLREISEIYEASESHVIAYAEETSYKERAKLSWISIPIYSPNVNSVVNQIQWNFV